MVGDLISQLSLTQCEFLHPQTLNPWSISCPNLTELSIYNCNSISDEMFIGEMPRLSQNPFENLEILTYEGHLDFEIGHFLLHSADKIKKVVLNINGEFPIRILDHLILHPKGHLEEVYLTVHQTEASFPTVLSRFIEKSPVLNRLELLCHDKPLTSALERIESRVKSKNWDLTFLFHVRQGRDLS